MHRLLLMARRLEESFATLHSYHPAVGEEAVVVGAFFGLTAGDYIAPHYRGALAAAYLRGADLRRLIAGVYGKSTAYNQGRFRGDICMPIELNVIGLFSGILGSSVGLAVGAALAMKLRGAPNVVVSTFGEGTSNLGMVHESLNLAASLTLPVVLICQNNQYAMSMSAKASLKCASVADRALGYGIPGVRVEGNDVIAVHAAVQEAVARARSGGGPTLIEALTYRVSGHRSGEQVAYQDPAERRDWQAKDPLRRLQESLCASGLLDGAGIAAVDTAVRSELSAAVQLAQQDPEPAPEVLGLDDVFAPENHQGVVP
ncbi:MAG TPA: thiamine pyrophosphate-dependent dehydrogenase E1 component subunit alpha [Steroidobacteraceae bacterium]|nr:thiamine pyrophosphate-dependent dehydrogenase E1 component subunit alpha [Steroidobacteraceae bacterium]